MKIVMTGGHHTCALPVIELLKRIDKGVKIYWMGHKYSAKGDKNPSLEYREITKLNIPFFDLKAGKFYKTFDILNLIRIPFGFIQALYVLAKVKPGVIMSFGGYLSVPVVLAGWILGVKSVTHEQTLVSGFANRLVSRFAKKVLVGWPSSGKYFPQSKVVVVGLPIRRQVFDKSSNSFEAKNGLPAIYITAGKQGSHKINVLVLESLEKLLSFCNVIHQCGDNSVYGDYDASNKKYSKIVEKSPVSGRYFVRRFVTEGEIGEAYAKASLVVSRAGAHTIYELLALKKPALLIPIPWASHDEQNINARFLADCGLAEVLDEASLSPGSFVARVREMVVNADKYLIKDAVLRSSLIPNSEQLIVDELLKVLGN
ncbi:glycosyltransferase [candidate division WWE3 bacterium]|nr:glycosyltransferase [candidate division WWE3 bacterium]